MPLEHNVLGDDVGLPIKLDGGFAHAFAEPDAHAYRCAFHYSMRGEVVVTT